jgi:hypothetical protein
MSSIRSTLPPTSCSAIQSCNAWRVNGRPTAASFPKLNWLLMRAKLPYRDLYSLRWTFVSLARASGEVPFNVSRVIGQPRSTIVDTIYAHTVDSGVAGRLRRDWRTGRGSNPPPRGDRTVWMSASMTEQQRERRESTSPLGRRYTGLQSRALSGIQTPRGGSW